MEDKLEALRWEVRHKDGIIARLEWEKAEEARMRSVVQETANDMRRTVQDKEGVIVELQRKLRAATGQVQVQERDGPSSKAQPAQGRVSSTSSSNTTLFPETSSPEDKGEKTNRSLRAKLARSQRREKELRDELKAAIVTWTKRVERVLADKGRMELEVIRLREEMQEREREDMQLLEEAVGL